MTDNQFQFSIVVPTRNEERDIRAVLDRLVRLSYPRKEILVVDDSTDQTPVIVSRYANRGVELIRGSNRGRCAARNQGILAAKGEIVVILNADVLVPDDFLEKIHRLYSSGADYVLVETEVSNTESVYGRFVEALHRSCYRGVDWIEWTEGFSCRRACAIQAGLFPDLPFPRVSGEDGFFGMKLRSKGYRKVVERSIVVQQIAPRDWREFWRQRKERGLPFAKALLEGCGTCRLFSWALGRTFLYLAQLASIMPVLCKAFFLARWSPFGLRDFPRFTWLYAAERVAFVSATWYGMWVILRRTTADSTGPEREPSLRASSD